MGEAEETVAGVAGVVVEAKVGVAKDSEAEGEEDLGGAEASGLCRWTGRRDDLGIDGSNMRSWRAVRSCSRNRATGVRWTV